MKSFLTWLKSLIIHPKEESTDMSEPLNDTAVVQQATAGQAGAVIPATAETIANDPAPSPVGEVKTGVADFEAALAFVESGVKQLGAAAKDELKLLAKKYL